MTEECTCPARDPSIDMWACLVPVQKSIAVICLLRSRILSISFGPWAGTSCPSRLKDQAGQTPRPDIKYFRLLPPHRDTSPRTSSKLNGRHAGRPIRVVFSLAVSTRARILRDVSAKAPSTSLLLKDWPYTSFFTRRCCNVSQALCGLYADLITTAYGLNTHHFFCGHNGLTSATASRLSRLSCTNGVSYARPVS
jgi:hypothetical protein